MNKVYIYCDGGLANRLGSLVSGICLSDRLKIGYEVIWPRTNWCDCDFKKLFDMDVECNLVTDNLKQYFEKFDIGVLLTHTPMDCPEYVEILDSNTEENYSKEFKKNIFYNNNRVANFLTQQEILKSLEKIKINNSIREIVDSFVNENNIDENTIGIHVRKTDFYFIHSDDFYGEMVYNCLPKKVFVCSDDKFSEENLQKKYSNTIIRKKTNYPEKIHDGSWINDNISNIYRGENSIIEALIDMQILSKTTIYDFDIESSFYKFAKIFNKLNKEKKDLPMPNTFEQILEKHLNSLEEVRGLIQVGTNNGMEIPYFEQYTKNFVLIEPLPGLVSTLKSNFPNYKILPFALGNIDETKEFYVALNGGASSSLLKPKLHLEYYPEITFYDKIDVDVRKFTSIREQSDIDTKNFNILMVDTQGYDLEVMKGFENHIYDFDLIICEFINVEYYEGNASLDDIEHYLSKRNFKLFDVEGSKDRASNAFFRKVEPQTTLKKNVLKKYKSPYFFETGTLHGEAIKLALEVGFEKIFSIEIDENLYIENYKRFREEIISGKVNLYLGDTIKIMPQILEKIDKQTTFWLDAHVDKGPSGIKKCPLYEEIDFIKNTNIEQHSILIDDIRCFGGGWWGDGISLEKLEEKLKEVNNNYIIKKEDGYIPQDVLVAYQ